MPTNKTPPITLRWPPELYDLYRRKAAELTHLSGGKQKFTVSSLAIDALEHYAKQEEWAKEESAESDQSTTSAELPS